MSVDSMKNSSASNIDFHSFNQASGQMIVLVSLAAHKVTFRRRNNIYCVLLNDNRKASHMIKENEKALKTKDSNLFGEKFKAYLKK